MKAFLVLSALSFMLSCQTNAAPTPTPEAVIFKRVIGAHSKTDPRSFFQVCEIRANQLKNLSEAKGIISSLKGEKKQVGYPFVAFVPSREYFYIENAKEQLVARYSSQIEDKPSSALAIKIIDEVCGSYDRKAKNAPKTINKNGRK